MTKLPSGVDIHNLIDDLRIFSWEAANILLYYSKIIKSSDYKKAIVKGDLADDPVTLADLKVNELIINRIKENYKDIDWDILSEENYKNNPITCNTKAEWLWVIDPLDGTKDFIQGTENYAMHLALNYKQKPVLGVVLIPEKNELWISFCERMWCETREGIVRKVNMLKGGDLRELTLVTSKNHRNKKLKELINKINFKQVVMMGSIGCKLTSIIRGECDIYISLSLPGESSPRDWDFAAPEAILRAAGGAITNLENEDLIYSTENLEQKGVIIASNNKQNHGNICSEIKAIIQKYQIFSLEN